MSPHGDDSEKTRFIPPTRPRNNDLEKTSFIATANAPRPGQLPPHPSRTSAPRRGQPQHGDRFERNTGVTGIIRNIVPPRPAVPPPQALTIGRSPSCTYIINDPVASRVHAFLVPTAAGLELRDNNSGNGTYVNGHPISTAILRQGDIITIGNTDVIARGNTLEYHTTAPDFQGVNAYGVTLDIDGKRLLNDISFTARPGTLTALIGPSGAGKSTLSKLVAGNYTPTGGQVMFDGRDVHREYTSLRTRIGMVPQQDVVHRLLTVDQALAYAAQLRLPTDATDEDRAYVIERVLADIGLTEHRATQITKLSGGQLKRVSVAMELLTSPALLIMDEPTSGLDPNLDRQVMRLLRTLADAGRVVLVVTHSTSNLNLCDQVVMLAPGGKTVFATSPNKIGAEMGTSDWSDIFEWATNNPDGVHHNYRQRHPQTPTPPIPSPGLALRDAPPPTNIYRQVWTVARRQARLIAADRGYAGFLIGMPVGLGLISLFLGGHRGLGVADPKDPSEPTTILAVLNLIAVFIGTFLTVRDLVGERNIFQREQAVGLSATAYLGAKLAIYSGIAAAQAAILTIIFLIVKGAPTRGAAALGSPSFEIYIAVAATTAVSAILGLALSAMAKTDDQVTQIIMGVLVTSVVFTGGMIPVTGRPVIEQIAGLFPGRWGFSATASTADLRALSPLAKDDVLWTHSSGWWLLNIGMLLTLGIIFTAFIRWKLRLPTTGTSNATPQPAAIIGGATVAGLTLSALLCGIIAASTSHSDRPAVSPPTSTPTAP